MAVVEGFATSTGSETPEIPRKKGMFSRYSILPK